jgi:hypothetical protein
MVSFAHEIDGHPTSVQVAEANLETRIDMRVSTKAGEYNDVSGLDCSGVVLVYGLR